MTPSDLIIRQLTRNEVDTAAAWAAAEGWNPGQHDAHVFHATDPGGFWGGFVGDELVTMISAVRYGKEYAFLGFYITAPAHRGKGYGYQIWQHVHGTLNGRLLGLDGVVDQQDAYARSGYVLTHRNVRQEGVTRSFEPTPGNVVALTSLPSAQRLVYDRSVFGFDRALFLREWISRPGTHARALLRDGDLVGYGVIRPCQVGFKIGPLFADDEFAAETLFQALVAAIPAESRVYLDTPEPNAAAMALAARRGMTPVFETARMYAHGTLDLPLDHWYGVTSFELG